LIYILDTNIISYLLKNRNTKLVNKFEEMSEEHTIGVSSITVAELYYGVKKKKSNKLEVSVKKFLSPLEKFSFDENSGYFYGEIRTHLESNGNTIGPHDMLIAAHAKSLGAVLVTNNTREFLRVDGLDVEDWVYKE